MGVKIVEVLPAVLRLLDPEFSNSELRRYRCSVRLCLFVFLCGTV
eukprot:SAG11_NODE_22487_length_405_cov_0.846405_1_plen_44_part_10